MGGLIWLASYPKSGNTWLRNFLHHLMINPSQPLKPNQLHQFTLGGDHRAWYDKAHGGPTLMLSEAELATLRPRAQALMTGASPDSVFVKTHSRVGDQGGTPLISPECSAGAIYVVRDPRDVVLSGADHYGLSIDDMITRMADPEAKLGGNADNVISYLSSWSVHVDSWTGRPTPQLLTLRYEDMEAKPLGTFGSIAKFLGLKVPRDRLERAIRFSSFKVSQRLEAEHGFRERSNHAQRFFRVGKSGQWRGQLSPEQIARLETDHGPVMRRFGYLR